MHCHLHIQGHLDPFWQHWFEDLEVIQKEEGTMLLSGSVQGQQLSTASWQKFTAAVLLCSFFRRARPIYLKNQTHSTGGGVNGFLFSIKKAE